MKNAVALLLTLLLTLSSCTGRTAPPATPSDADAGNITAESERAAGRRETAKALPDIDLREKKADFDLTGTDTQMAYVRLSNMMLYPEDYEGKTVKLRGTFAHAAEGDREFFVCYLMDATACCSQSLEFETDEPYDFPGGYPPEESGITVFGVFDTYEYNGYKMYRLVHAEVDYES